MSLLHAAYGYGDRRCIKYRKGMTVPELAGTWTETAGACLPPPRLQGKLDDAERPIEEQEQDPLARASFPLMRGGRVKSSMTANITGSSSTRLKKFAPITFPRERAPCPFRREVMAVASSGRGFPDYSYGTAVNILKSVIAFAMVSFVNKAADKFAETRLF